MTVDDLVTWLRDQLDAVKFRAESLRVMARALPPEAGAYLTETADLLLADVDADRGIIDLAASITDQHDDEQVWYQLAIGDVLRRMALPYADRPGYRPEWAPNA